MKIPVLTGKLSNKPVVTWRQVPQPDVSFRIRSRPVHPATKRSVATLSSLSVSLCHAETRVSEKSGRVLSVHSVAFGLFKHYSSTNRTQRLRDKLNTLSHPHLLTFIRFEDRKRPVLTRKKRSGCYVVVAVIHSLKTKAHAFLSVSASHRTPLNTVIPQKLIRYQFPSADRRWSSDSSAHYAAGLAAISNVDVRGLFSWTHGDLRCFIASRSRRVSRHVRIERIHTWIQAGTSCPNHVSPRWKSIDSINATIVSGTFHGHLCIGSGQKIAVAYHSCAHAYSYYRLTRLIRNGARDHTTFNQHEVYRVANSDVARLHIERVSRLRRVRSEPMRQSGRSCAPNR